MASVSTLRRCALRHISRLFCFVTLCAGLFSAGSTVHAAEAENWPQFRGPRGDGRADASDPPVQFGEQARLRWKVAIHGKGWSSPVVWKDQIWLTTATEDGKKMSVLCVDRQTGRMVHDRVLFENENPAFCHPTNSYASPTSVIEDGRVYVHFGSYGTACLDTRTGETLWQQRDLPCDHWRGPGSSLIVHKDTLYVPFDGYDLQYVAAIDKHTGAVRWKVDRQIDYGSDDGDVKKAYGTCQMIEVDGREQLVCPSAAETIAYDPSDGKELWRFRHGGMNAATRPLFANGLLLLTVGDAVGDSRSALLAIRPSSLLTAEAPSPAIAWRMDKSPPKRPSPLVIDDLVFTINDEGVACCLNLADGETLWQQRIPGTYRASPVYAQGRIYFASLDGDVTVIAADRTYKALATNRLENGFQASPAIHGNALILRSTAHLYCFE